MNNKTLLSIIVILFAYNYSSAQVFYNIKPKNNYIHIKSDFERQINRYSATKVIFLYVHSDNCPYSKIVAPVVKKLSKKYSNALFLQVDIENARNFLKQRYKVRGTPNLMLIYQGNIASFQYSFPNTSREESITKWAEQNYPVLRKLNNYRNIYNITAFNYKNLMKDKTIILYRGNGRLGDDFTKNIELVYSLAKKYPHLNFGITTGQIPYGQEIDSKYAKVYRRFSIIKNIDEFKAILEPYGGTHSLPELTKWIEQNIK